MTRGSRVLAAARAGLVALERSGKAVTKASRVIAERKGDIIVTGIGKSGFIGQKFTASLVSLGERAFYLHPTEALHGDVGVLSRDDVLIALSFSGESREVVGIAKYAKKNFGVKIIAICKDSVSSLGRLADAVVNVPVAEEGSPNDIAPMASTTATLVLCDMLAASLARPDAKRERFAKNHPGGALGLSLKKVREFAVNGTKVPKVKAEDSFARAVREISAKGFGITAVVDARNVLVGAITDGDIRRFVLSKGDASAASAGGAMTKQPKCIRQNSSLQEALELMERHKITSLFVTDTRGRLSGVLHVHRILEEVVQ